MCLLHCCVSFYLCTLQERDTEAAELVQQVERLTADKQRMEQECEDTKVCANHLMGD
jgi:hypothetical protein